MVNFLRDPNLGQVVDLKQMKVWSFGIDPITSIDELRFAAGEAKFGLLCAFKFKTLNQSAQYKYFDIAFSGRITDKHHNPSKVAFGNWGSDNTPKWYIYKKIDLTRADVLDKKTLLLQYGFDVDKFLDSNMFKVMLPRIKTAIDAGLTDKLDKFLETLTIPSEFKHLPSQKDAKAIEEAKEFARKIYELSKSLDTKEVYDKYYKVPTAFALLKTYSKTEKGKIDNVFKRYAARDEYYALKHATESDDLDEKIEQELKRKGIYVDLNEED